MTAPSLETISAYLLDLHRACHELPLRAFQERCFEGLERVVPFDSGLAGAGTLQRGVPCSHDMHLHRVSPALLESWGRIKHLDLVAMAALSSPGRTQRFVVDEVFADLPVALEHCRTFSLAHVLCTAAIAERAGSYFVLSLYRHDPEQPFSETERSAIEVLVPHVVEAMRQAKLEELRRAARISEQTAVVNRAAVVNRTGVVLDAEPAFVELLASAYPDWSGPWLPPPLAPIAAADRDTWHTVGRLLLRVAPREDLVLVHARSATPVDALTEREHQVARLFARGASAKEVAAELDIAANTVRVHLGRVYEKLGIVNKAELASMLADDDRPAHEPGAGNANASWRSRRRGTA